MEVFIERKYVKRIIRHFFNKGIIIVSKGKNSLILRTIFNINNITIFPTLLFICLHGDERCKRKILIDEIKIKNKNKNYML